MMYYIVSTILCCELNLLIRGGQKTSQARGKDKSSRNAYTSVYIYDNIKHLIE